MFLHFLRNDDDFNCLVMLLERFGIHLLVQKNNKSLIIFWLIPNPTFINVWDLVMMLHHWFNYTYLMLSRH